MIYIIDDDPVFCDVLNLAVQPLGETKVFHNIIDAVNSLDDHFPDLILLDILLTGPDGFTLLNELASYTDTKDIPIVILSALDLTGQDLSHYGVRHILDKSKTSPQEIRQIAKELLHA